MKPLNDNLIDRLAADYAVGTLRGAARRRLEAWRRESPAVEQRCQEWELRLAALALRARPIAPPAGQWNKLRDRLGFAPQVPLATRWVAGLAVLALFGALSVQFLNFRPLRPDAVAVLASPSGHSNWQVEVYTRSGRLVMHSNNAPRHPSNRDFELWALPKNGAAPVSLGLMPSSGEASETLTAEQAAALAQSAQVAISVEPVGGSPTHLPTGPVVFVAPLNTVS
jgi:anti-sigma-K factor RskA